MKASRDGGGVRERQRAGAVPHPVSGIDVVLDEDGNAVERPAHLPFRALAVTDPGDLDRDGVRLDDRVQTQTAIDLEDPPLVHLRDRDGGPPPFGHPKAEVGDRRLFEIERAEVRHTGRGGGRQRLGVLDDTGNRWLVMRHLRGGRGGPGDGGEREKAAAIDRGHSGTSGTQLYRSDLSSDLGPRTCGVILRSGLRPQWR